MMKSIPGIIKQTQLLSRYHSRAGSLFTCDGYQGATTCANWQSHLGHVLIRYRDLPHRCGEVFYLLYGHLQWLFTIDLLNIALLAAGQLEKIVSSE